MKGTPINEAKRGLLEVARVLQSENHVSSSRFGSGIEHLWRTPRPCNSYHMKQLVSTIKSTDANMGCTNMEEAILTIFSYITRKEKVDLATAVVLTTDGQAGNVEEEIEAARNHITEFMLLGWSSFSMKSFYEE